MPADRLLQFLALGMHSSCHVPTQAGPPEVSLCNAWCERACAEAMGPACSDGVFRPSPQEPSSSFPNQQSEATLDIFQEQDFFSRAESGESLQKTTLEMVTTDLQSRMGHFMCSRNFWKRGKKKRCFFSLFFSTGGFASWWKFQDRLWKDGVCFH